MFEFDTSSIIVPLRLINLYKILHRLTEKANSLLHLHSRKYFYRKINSVSVSKVDKI